VNALAGEVSASEARLLDAGQRLEQTVAELREARGNEAELAALRSEVVSARTENAHLRELLAAFGGEGHGAPA
jgi:predicted  nucleic acid-binding Zn-ribbon protein